MTRKLPPGSDEQHCLLYLIGLVHHGDTLTWISATSLSNSCLVLFSVHLHVYFGDDLAHGVEALVLCGEVEFRVVVLTGLLTYLYLGVRHASCS